MRGRMSEFVRSSRCPQSRKKQRRKISCNIHHRLPSNWS